MVTRNPAERIVSLFNNKIVNQIYAEDMYENIHLLTGKNASDFTFYEFVYDYLLKYQWSDLDPHCLPQSMYMLPIEYDELIPIQFLNSFLLEYWGDSAGRYTGNTVNATGVTMRLDGAHRMTVHELRQHARDGITGLDYRSLLSDSIENDVLERYSDDMNLYLSSLANSEARYPHKKR